jgi:hypothetical protein
MTQTLYAQMKKKEKKTKLQVHACNLSYSGKSRFKIGQGKSRKPYWKNLPKQKGLDMWIKYWVLALQV